MEGYGQGTDSLWSHAAVHAQGVQADPPTSSSSFSLIHSTSLSPAVDLPVQIGKDFDCTAGDSVGKSEAGASGSCPT